MDTYPNRYSVTWADSDTLPARGPADSMPLGNGEVGLNVWVDARGDVLFYVARTDAWSQDARLLKLGRVRVSLDPNPARDASGEFHGKQFLNLEKGRVEVTLGRKGQTAGEATVWVWVDANAPVAHVEVQSDAPAKLRATLEIWRTERRELAKGERFSCWTLKPDDVPIYEEPDTLVEQGPNRVVWCHRNERSMWPEHMKHQGLEGLIGATASDPLLGRTFGGMMMAPGAMKVSPAALETREAGRRHSVSILTHTAQTASQREWSEQLYEQHSRLIARPDLRRARTAHERWWRTFWKRSWIVVTGNAEAEAVTRGYTLQRFINACAGRGRYPIKFNGSLFAVDWTASNKDRSAGAGEWNLPDEDFDADYRRWGGPYWFQNTRLAYWPMLAAGDFEMMRPLFEMFRAALPLARERVRVWFNHGGAHFPETMHFWGNFSDGDYGFDRAGKPVGHVQNRYVGRYYSQGLELAQLMLDYYAHTGEKAFLRDTLLPITNEVLRFYDQHFQRDERGKLRMAGTQALETWQEAVNPTPDIAGLMAVLDALLALPADATGDEDRALWTRLRGEVPPLPLGTPGSEPGAKPEWAALAGKRVIWPAEELLEEMKNSENAELYSVFPHRLFGLGKPELELARDTFVARRVKDSRGWRQDAIQAALLGLTDEAKRDVVANFTTHYGGTRFPAFWGPNFDWIPDQDHGGVAMIALQAMLMHVDPPSEQVRLLPAWPPGWDADFRLHAPGKTIVEGEVRGGKLARLTVTPSERRKDVVVAR